MQDPYIKWGLQIYPAPAIEQIKKKITVVAWLREECN